MFADPQKKEGGIHNFKNFKQPPKWGGGELYNLCTFLNKGEGTPIISTAKQIINFVYYLICKYKTIKNFRKEI